MAIEQFPLGPKLDRLVLLGPEDLVRAAVENRRNAAIGRARAVKLGTHRIRRRRISRIDTAVRQRLQRYTEVEVRQPELGALRAERLDSADRAVAAGLDGVVVVADAAVEDDEIAVVRAIHRI